MMPRRLVDIPLAEILPGAQLQRSVRLAVRVLELSCVAVAVRVLPRFGFFQSARDILRKLTVHPPAVPRDDCDAELVTVVILNVPRAG
jgi:hypothetical protein